MRSRVLRVEELSSDVEQVDVVVVGSGVTGLAAATLAADQGAEVLLLEKGEQLGGTTAVSGGAMWVPGNAHAHEVGAVDDRDDALAYLEHLCAGDAPDPELLRVFVDEAPRMLAYLEQHTPLQVAAIPGFPDYYLHLDDVPGRRSAGRAVEALPFSVAEELPDLVDRLPVRSTMGILGARTTHAEERAAPAPDELAARLAERERRDVRAKGVALVARLLKGLRDRGVEVRPATPVTGLVLAADRVVGVRVGEPHGERLIGARRGVVLASGGFEWNEELLRGFVGHRLVPVSVASNTGDGLQMLMQAGAALANMRAHFGTAVAFDPDAVGAAAGVAQAGLPIRTHPGTVIVNARAERFVNEHQRYNDFAKVFGNHHAGRPGPATTPEAWLVFDSAARAQVPVLSATPDRPSPPWLHESSSLAELAERIGLDPEVLSATIVGYNTQVDADQPDPFGRTNRRPLSAAPFFALRIHAGTLGTTGGARITSRGEVLGVDGQPVDGLYAAGTAAAGVFGYLYPSGGSPLAMGLTFGALAGRAAGQAGTERRRESSEPS